MNMLLTSHVARFAGKHHEKPEISCSWGILSFIHDGFIERIMLT
jgi:hypothetical protein